MNKNQKKISFTFSNNFKYFEASLATIENEKNILFVKINVRARYISGAEYKTVPII